MVKKRPCRICHKWYRPDPRAGNRQRVCSEDECQKERHRRACQSWRDNNPDYDREARLRKKLRIEGHEEVGSGFESGPLRGKLCWAAARDAIGLKACIIIDESVKLLLDAARDAAPGQPSGNKGKSGKDPIRWARDEIDRGGSAP